MTATTLYVYGIARADKARLDDLRGLGDAPLERVVVGDVEAIVSPLANGVPGPSEEAVVRHDAVCSALMTDTPLAPARFGSAFSDEAGLRAELEERRDELEGLLDRLEGRVELGVRALRAASSPDPAAQAVSGTDYLRARLAERQAALAAAAEVDARLTPLAVARTASMLETADVLLSASYLVERDDVDAFRAEVADLDRSREDVTLLCTGPWPPYSFVGGDE